MLVDLTTVRQFLQRRRMQCSTDRLIEVVCDLKKHQAAKLDAVPFSIHTLRKLYGVCPEVFIVQAIPTSVFNDTTFQHDPSTFGYKYIPRSESASADAPAPFSSGLLVLGDIAAEAPRKRQPSQASSAAGGQADQPNTGMQSATVPYMYEVGLQPEGGGKRKAAMRLQRVKEACVEYVARCHLDWLRRHEPITSTWTQEDYRRSAWNKDGGISPAAMESARAKSGRRKPPALERWHPAFDLAHDVPPIPGRPLPRAENSDSEPEDTVEHASGSKPDDVGDLGPDHVRLLLHAHAHLP